MAESGEDRLSPELISRLAETEQSSIIEADGCRIFVELLGKPGKLVICGGGHVAQQAVILAKHTGFHVTVLEDRPFFADQARAAGADQVICDDFCFSPGKKFPEAVILIFWLLQEAIGMMESALLQF